MSKLITFPSNHPPLPPTISAIERRRLPVVIPAYYSLHDINRRLAGEWQPTHIATVTRIAIYDIEAMAIAKLNSKQSRRIA